MPISASSRTSALAAWLLGALATGAALPVTAQQPLPGGSGAVMRPTAVSRAHIDVAEGRAVVLGGGDDTRTIRRGQSLSADGRSQIEIGAGGRVRVRWTGTLSMDVYGPASVEWDARGDSLNLRFHELSWADIECRDGQHSVTLPSEWRAGFERGSFHLRGLSGGPTELRCNAGVPVIVDWRGDDMELRPPVNVYPGSSVRLDRPRNGRQESPMSRDRLGRWGAPGTPQADLESWPYRQRADSPAEVRERAALARETQELTEVAGQPDGQVTSLRAYEVDGSSSVRPLGPSAARRAGEAPLTPLGGSDAPRRTDARSRTVGGATYAQVPVTPAAPSVEFTPRPQVIPARPETEPLRRLAPVESPVESPVQSQGDTRAGGSAASRADFAPATASPVAVAYDPSQWRELSRARLNGVGEIAAERGSAVEVRILGGGRTKVFVGASSPSPRWCFTPTADYLIQPGAVAMFDADGSLRMSLGDVQVNAPIAGRPSFSQLPK